MPKKGRDDLIKFVLRIPPELHQKIKKGAKKQNTSMNRYIENTLMANETERDIDLKIIKDEVARILQIIEGYDFS